MNDDEDVPEVDEQLMHIVADIMRWGSRWWMRPFRRRLLSIVAELSVCARQSREMREAVDTYVGDAHEEELRKMATEYNAGLLVLAELNHIVARQGERQ